MGAVTMAGRALLLRPGRSEAVMLCSPVIVRRIIKYRYRVGQRREVQPVEHEAGKLAPFVCKICKAVFTLRMPVYSLQMTISHRRPLRWMIKVSESRAPAAYQ